MWSWTGSRVRHPSSNSAGGFTLIEVLVALAVLALTLVALLQIFTAGLRSTTVADRHIMSTMLARSVLEEVGAEIPLISGENSDEIEQGYRWTVRILPSAAAEPVVHDEGLLVLYEVEVEVSWEGKPVTALNTLRLGMEPGLPFGGGFGAPARRQ